MMFPHLLKSILDEAKLYDFLFQEFCFISKFPIHTVQLARFFALGLMESESVPRFAEASGTILRPTD
jgi:hypothetical protein